MKRTKLTRRMQCQEAFATPTYEYSFWNCTKEHDTDRWSHLCEHHLLSRALICKELEAVDHLDLDAETHSIGGSQTSQNYRVEDLQNVRAFLLSRGSLDDTVASFSFDLRLNQKASTSFLDSSNTCRTSRVLQWRVCAGV